MAEPTLVAFQAQHLLAIASRNPFDDTLIDDAWRKSRGPSFTAMIDGKPIGCAGVVILWPGVGYAWAVFSHDFIKHKLWITRYVRRAFRDIINGCNLHRVEAQVLEEQTEYAKWLEMLGFESEGVARDYTSDRRAVTRYVWLRYKVMIRHIKIESTSVARAIINGEVVGYAAHQYTPEGHAYGAGVSVIEEHRNKGIGLMLHKARLEEARRHGAKFFAGMSTNPTMIRILEQCGARRCENELGVTYICKLGD